MKTFDRVNIKKSVYNKDRANREEMVNYLKGTIVDIKHEVFVNGFVVNYYLIACDDLIVRCFTDNMMDYTIELI